MTDIFNWSDYGNDIHIGVFATQAPKRRKVDNRKKRNRDWSKEYQKRILAGTANKVKAA